MRQILFAAVLLLCVPVAVRAHGGIYVAPPDAGGGSKGSGGNATPPTNPGGSATPSPGSPTSRTGGGGVTGNPRGGNPRSGGHGPVTGQQDEGASGEDWEFWWENNKDRFLDLKRRPDGSNVSGGAGASVLTNRGRPSGTIGARRPTLAVIQGEVLPTLAGLLKGAGERDIVDSSILALARATPEESADTVRAAATPLLAHGELSVQSAAVLALGIAGAKSAVPTLQALMADAVEGRRLVGGGGVPVLVRAFAALSLGLVDDPSAVPGLIDVIERSRDSERDVKTAAIVALGLMHGAATEPASAYLVQKLTDRKLDAVIASAIPTALGRLDAVEAVPALLAVFRSHDTDSFVQQSAALALGQLARLDQAAVIEALTACIAEGRDAQTRHYCLISLGQIGARAAETRQDGLEKEHAALVRLLDGEIRKPDNADHRSWAALAAAIYGRASGEASDALRPRLGETWEKERNPSFRGALAIALGLLRATEMGPQLFEDLQGSSDTSLRGYTAVSLGFLRFTEAAELLRQQCRLKGLTPTYRLQVATALGLMGDSQAVPILIETLQSSETLGVSSAVARALGLIGDTSAVEPLKALALDAEAMPSVRGFACVALGILCEKTDLPWNAAIRADNNYRATVPAIAEVLDIL